jgi:excisionase family DNA binding protein
MHTIFHVEADRALNRPRNQIHKHPDVVMRPGGDPMASGVSAILSRQLSAFIPFGICMEKGAKVNKPGDIDAFLDVAQLSQRWHSHPETIRRLIRRGEINAVLIGRRYLIAATDVHQMEAARQINIARGV